ncbi:MAG: multiheme c-type cytochrome [Desulfobacterales bacterium]|nr:multiheme c-type cytochrome [Desulfobacterales bacterium]
MNRPPYKAPGNKNVSNNIKSVLISYWGIWVILAVLFVLVTIRISGFKPHAGEKIEAVATLKAPVFGKAFYLGSKRCKDCHWVRYDSWQNTLHSKFMQPVGEYTIIGDFERNNTLTIKISDKPSKDAGKDVRMTMFKKEDRYYVSAEGSDGQPRDYEISNVLGIGRYQNYLTKFPNGEIHVLPVEWNVKDRRWTDRKGLKDNFHENGPSWDAPENIWQFKCGGCHVTGIEINYDPDKNSFNSTWADLGIGCEACHGPGSNHVKAASEYFDYEKETIVNPARLPWRLRAMVCGQCHNWGVSTVDLSEHREGFPKKYGYPYGFLPGKALYLFYEEEVKEKRHHQQYNEWISSEHSSAGIMCTSCHEVHQKEDIQVAMTKVSPDNLCMGCHKTLERRSAHRIHTFGSCVACHMPKTIGHEHSHTFQFISPELSIKAGGVEKQPNSCSNCHHHKDTPLENLVDFLAGAKKADMPKPFSVHQR